jgi:hypothetical protein
MNSPDAQILILGCIEVALIIIKCVIYFRKLVDNRLMVLIGII